MLNMTAVINHLFLNPFITYSRMKYTTNAVRQLPHADTWRQMFFEECLSKGWKMDIEKTGIGKHVLEEIKEIAKENKINKVVLFGSRSRGDFYKKSDIDLAVQGGDVTGFALDVEEKTETLLHYDVADMQKAQDELLKNILKDGVVIYEKI